MHDRDSQCAYILRVLERGRTITAGQALKGFGIARLAARIKDLREEGYDITTAMVPVTNRHGKQTRIARYFMRSKRTTTGEE
jgi:hypothetical protein